MATVKKAPTETDLINDLQRVHQKQGKVSRDSYEQYGKFTRTNFEKFWPTFTAFASAAGIEKSKHAAAVESETEGSEQTGDKWSVSLKTFDDSLEGLVAHFKVDLSIWEVERFRCNKWAMGYTTGPDKYNREAASHPLFQVRADFKKKKDVLAIKQEIADLLAEAKVVSPKPKAIVRKSPKGNNMLEVSVPDLHIGKLAWGRETGFDNYDSRIAETIYLQAIEALIARSSAHNFEEVLFVVGNDLLQADDTESQTTSGTVVDTDARYYKTFRIARRATIAAIELLRAVAPVKVVVVPGNHDRLSAWHLGESLDIYFNKYEDVTVDNEPTPRKFHQFGKVMLMLCHGDKGKRNDYPLTMATERAAMFGETRYRECHTGHTHQTKLDEQHGVRVRVLPALCPPDEWHSANNLTGNLRAAEAYVWNKDEGLIATVFYNADAHPAVNTVSEIKVG